MSETAEVQNDQEPVDLHEERQKRFAAMVAAPPTDLPGSVLQPYHNGGQGGVAYTNFTQRLGLRTQNLAPVAGYLLMQLYRLEGLVLRLQGTLNGGVEALPAAAAPEPVASGPSNEDLQRRLMALHERLKAVEGVSTIKAALAMRKEQDSKRAAPKG